jgi:putative ABC transport system permease protein
MGIPLLRGRTFAAADFDQNRPVGIISDAFAKRYFPDADPVGKRICGNLEIVGVVADARLSELRSESGPMLYRTAAQDPDRVSALEVRVSGDPAPVVAAIRQHIRSINPRLLIDVTTIRRQIDISMARERMVASISAFFCVLGLLLAGVGIFGVASNAVAQRTNELGIRMALGPSRWSVVRESMQETMLVFAVGLSAGIIAAIAAVRLTTSVISNLLFGLTPTDTANMVTAMVVMTIVALIACLLPARRATRIDPLAAIRCE